MRRLAGSIVGASRGRYLALAAVLGAALGAIPAIASSETTPTITAYNEPGLYGKHLWTPSTATILAGGVVTFSNPSSEVPHGLKFTGGPATPACSGLPPGASEETGAYHWTGQCTFSAPGTYTFICTVHPGEMTGTVTVEANGTTTVTTTPTTTTTTPTTTAPSSPPPPLLVAPVKLAKAQRGSSVRGTLDLSQAAAGGRLEVDLFAKGGALAGRHHGTRVLVGRLLRSALTAGTLSFSVKLDSAGRRALHHKHRLSLVVSIALKPTEGKALLLTRTVEVHS